MLPEIRYELLFFYTRDKLERLQPLSQTLLDMIVAGSNVLPLRPICCVDMSPRTLTDRCRITNENGYNNEELQLLTRESFLKNLQSCHLAIWEGAFPPPSFFLNEPGYPNYELWCKNSNVAVGIDGFIESFVRDGCANKRLKSVCIQWFDGEGQQSPAPEQLKKPTEIDMPLATIDLTAWLIRTVHQMSQCEMNSFVNAKQWKQMDVYKWTIDYNNYYGRITTDIYQCRVRDL